MVSTNRLTLFIVIFMLMGILSGAATHVYATLAITSAWTDDATLLAGLFLWLVKMVIAPLMFSTLTAGIMHLDKTATIDRIGGKTMARFIISPVLSILIEPMIAALQYPGAGLDLAVPKEAVDVGLTVNSVSLKGSLSHTIPTSTTETMVNNEILQTVVFSMLSGIAGASLGEKFNAPLVMAFNAVLHIMLKVTGYVMYVAPLVIFAAISSAIASQGLEVLLNYASFIGSYYLAMLLTSAVLVAVSYMALRREVFRLLNMLKDPVLVAFATGSFEVAYPKTLEQLAGFGYSCSIVSFALPIGYSFNLVDSVIYCPFAAILIVQAYSVPLDFSEITVMILALTLALKGTTGVSRSALMVLMAMIPSFSTPVAGILLLTGIDHFLGMGRSTINMLGNDIAIIILSKNEGLLIDEEAQPDWEAEKAGI